MKLSKGKVKASNYLGEPQSCNMLVSKCASQDL